MQSKIFYVYFGPQSRQIFKFCDFAGVISVSFQQVALKFCNFTDFKAFFPAVWTDFR